MSKEAIEDYAEAIQNYFGQKRGASLIASPNDFLKIEEWFKKGIPLRAVQKGIGRHFEKIDPSRCLRAVVIRFAEGAIIDEWEIMKAGGAGPTGKASPEDEAAERKERIEAFINRCREARESAELWATPIFDELITIAEGDREIVSSRGVRKFDGEDTEIFIEVWLRRNTSPERMESPRRTAEQALAPYKDRMDSDTYKEVLETNTLEALRTELGVPKLMEE